MVRGAQGQVAPMAVAGLGGVSGNVFCLRVVAGERDWRICLPVHRCGEPGVWAGDAQCPGGVGGVLGNRAGAAGAGSVAPHSRGSNKQSFVVRSPVGTPVRYSLQRIFRHPFLQQQCLGLAGQGFFQCHPGV